MNEECPTTTVFLWVRQTVTFAAQSLPGADASSHVHRNRQQSTLHRKALGNQNTSVVDHCCNNFPFLLFE